MRIVHIITRLIVGGAQENTLLSCEGQHRLGHQVMLITGPALGPEGSLMDRAQAAGYQIEVLDSMRRSILPAQDFLTYRHLTNRLTELQPDIVHTHSSKAGIIGRWAAHAAAVPVIIHTIHGLAFTASTHPLVNRMYQFLERHTAPITTKMVCVADAMRDQSLAANIGTPNQYITIYSGMETAPFLSPPVSRSIIRQQLGIAENDIIVGTIARLFHLKGHEDLLELAPSLCLRFPQLRFLWVGDGLLREQFQHQIQKMNLQNRFILTGLVPPEKIPQLTNAMDILAHPSRREGLARALPQGQLCGIPCVTYDIDGAKEGVIDGATGFVIPPFNRQKFAAAISQLIEDTPRRRAMGTAGRTFALQRFDSQTMTNALDSLYRQTLKNRQ